MRVLVSGTSGLIGSALTRKLAAEGHTVLRLVRKRDQVAEDTVYWDTTQGTVEWPEDLAVDALVHLAGENIADGRWTTEKKRRIRDTRIQGTALLASTIAALPHPPRVWACASAIGFYGDRGEEVLDEESSSGHGFLAEVCQEWEAATCPAADVGIRVANLRFGMVLSNHGGALPAMSRPFKLGLGGVAGDGAQYVSWISLADAVGAIIHILTTDTLSGPVNIVSPHPVTNREFTKTLGHVLHRPTVLPLPGFAARVALGEIADELILTSTRVKPAKLEAARFDFAFTRVEEALRRILST